MPTNQDLMNAAIKAKNVKKVQELCNQHILAMRYNQSVVNSTYDALEEERKKGRPARYFQAQWNPILPKGLFTRAFLREVSQKYAKSRSEKRRQISRLLAMALSAHEEIVDSSKERNDNCRKSRASSVVTTASAGAGAGALHWQLAYVRAAAKAKAEALEARLAAEIEMRDMVARNAVLAYQLELERASKEPSEASSTSRDTLTTPQDDAITL